jgi:hypothetical protein
MTTLNWSQMLKDAGDLETNYEPIPNGDYEM